MPRFALGHALADTDVNLAFRARCEALVVATTGLTSLASTVGGYVRLTGNFETEGFVVGMEVVSGGFPENTPGTIIGVTPLSLIIYPRRIARSVAANRQLTVGLPALRIWDNQTGTPDPLVPYIEADFLTQPGSFISGHKEGGWREDRGLYVVRWYGIADTGTLGLSRSMDALKARFTPHTTLAVPSEDEVVRVRADSAPNASRITQRASGHALSTLTIPWQVYRRNITLA